MAPPAEGVSFPRVLGRHEGQAPGPTVVVIGGIHGNEPAGAYAAARVILELERRRPPFRGRLLALAGNLGALRAKRRFIDRDLNRVWHSDAVRLLKERDPATDGPEDTEQRALIECIDRAREDSDEGIVLLDLHTTSGGGPPFSLMSDTIRNRRIAFALPVPMILGLEESIDGTLLEYATQHGDTALVVEGGQHDEAAAIDNHEAVIWLTLMAAGCLREQDVPDVAGQLGKLRRVAHGLPRVVEVRYRHPVRPGDGFSMRPGYVGMQKIAKGELLADDGHGEIRAQIDGRMLMPLYQSQGSDGFFLVSPVSVFWLALSHALRRLHAHTLLPLLPGVARDADEPGALRVDRNVARWFVVEVFHLLGFRRRRQLGDHFVFSRRRPG